MNPPRPVIWSIAGLDTAGGAGLSADQRAADALGVHLCPVAAVLTLDGTAWRIDALQTANPAIASVVVVGADDQIPMARVQDATRIANERGRAFDYPGQTNQTVSALAGGFISSSWIRGTIAV